MSLRPTQPLPDLDGLGVNVHAPDPYAPHAHVQGYDVLHDGTRPYVPRMEHNATIKAIEAERDELRAEVDRLRSEVESLRTVTHLAPNGVTRHPGMYATCAAGECVNDREDDAQYSPPPYRSQRVPQRRDNGQRGVA